MNYHHYSKRTLLNMIQDLERSVTHNSRKCHTQELELYKLRESSEHFRVLYEDANRELASLMKEREVEIARRYAPPPQDAAYEDLTKRKSCGAGYIAVHASCVSSQPLKIEAIKTLRSKINEMRGFSPGLKECKDFIEGVTNWYLTPQESVALSLELDRSGYLLNKDS